MDEAAMSLGLHTGSKSNRNRFNQIGGVMKKTIIVFLAFLFSLGFGGCASMPMRVYESLPKTNLICLGEVKMFKGERGMVSCNSFSKPVDNDPYYQEVGQKYLTVLKANLEKKGFVVVDKPDPQALILETKIGDIPPLLGGWMGGAGMGLVAARVEIKQNDRLLLSFEQAVGTTLGYKAGKQIRRFIAPRIAKKLGKLFSLK